MRDVEAIREHYALTLRGWVANLEARLGRGRARSSHPAGPGSGGSTWPASALSFERNRIGVNQILATKAADRTGAGSWPLRRPDWSGAVEDHGRA